MNNDFDSAMSALSPVGSLRDTPQNVVKKPVSSDFLGDAILNVKISVAVTGGAVPANLSFPVYLFGAIHFNSGYADVLQSAPSAYTFAVSTSGGDVVQTYTDGANVLTCTVSSSTTSYRSILEATLTDFMKTSKIRATVTPSTAADAQFAEPFKSFEKSVFGGVKQNSIDVDVNKSPENFQNNIVDIVESIQIDGKKGIVANVNSDTASYILNIGTSQYYKAGANF